MRIHYLSPDVMAVAYAPHEPLFARAAAIVHQGGIGTFSEAMRAGKPTLIMPYGHDQADNAWRASRLGVARVISRRKYRAMRCRRRSITSCVIRRTSQSASSIARTIAQEQGAVMAADLVEETLHAAGRSPSTLSRSVMADRPLLC